MDTRLNRHIETYLSNFKGSIKDKVFELNFSDIDKVQELLTHTFNYERLVLTKDDVTKRKRVKNSIPCENRCHALRSNGEQCTRKQKEGELFCGTHYKGTPHGVVNTEKLDSDVMQVEVYAQDVSGIICYIDKNGNVYRTEDVLNGVMNPEIISNYNK